jgi:hypothetical protein
LKYYDSTADCENDKRRNGDQNEKDFYFIIDECDKKLSLFYECKANGEINICQKPVIMNLMNVLMVSLTKNI